jgi:phenylacetate-coenzyme A ligase PaaK-like adenylate-forming protein
LALALRGYDAWELRRWQIARPEGLAALLSHAAETVPYYRTLFSGSTPDGLNAFPIVGRSDISAAPRTFLADRLCSSDDTRFAKTSGTTGRPLTVIFDLASWYDLAQDSYATFARTIPGLRDAVRPGRVGVAMLTNETLRQQTTVPLLGLRCALFRRYSIGADERDALVVKDLRRKSPPLLHGKGSCLVQLAGLDRRVPGRRRIRPLAILVSGENLFDDVRSRLEDAFGCRVYNAYISAEGGLIALDCPHGHGLHVQEARVSLEVMKSDATCRSEGSGELVLTNLFNWAMPFIRYRTGDHGTLRRCTCECGHRGATLVSLPARELTAFQVAAGTVTTARLARALAHPDVADFQLIQFDNNRYSLKWVPAGPGVRADEVERQLGRRLSSPLSRSRIQMHAVQAITKPGGKAKRFVAAASPKVRRQGGRRRIAAVEALGSVRTVAFSPAGNVIAVGTKSIDGSGELILCDASGRARRSLSDGRDGCVVAIAFDPEGGRLVSAGEDRCTRLWDIASGKCVTRLDSDPEVLSLAFSTDGRDVALGGNDGGVMLWRLEQANALTALGRRHAPVTAVTFTPDGRYLAAASTDGSIALWGGTTWTESNEIRVPSSVRSLAFSPDGDVVAIAGDRSAIELWDVIAASRMGALETGAAAVTSLAFSADAKTLASGASDGSVTLWQAWTGQELDRLSQQGRVCSLAFAPDGRLLVAGGPRGLRLWPVVPLPEA